MRTNATPREAALRADARATFLAALEYGVHPLLARRAGRPVPTAGTTAPAPESPPPARGIAWVKGPGGVLRPANPRTAGGAQ